MYFNSFFKYISVKLNMSFGFLISGSSNTITGNTFPCIGADKFSVSIHAINNLVAPTTGDVLIQARTINDNYWTTIHTESFTGRGDVMVQFNGPFDSIRAILQTGISATGTFTATYRLQIPKGY